MAGGAPWKREAPPSFFLLQAPARGASSHIIFKVAARYARRGGDITIRLIGIEDCDERALLRAEKREKCDQFDGAADGFIFLISP